ncbi:MAG: hypothetical protein JNM24_12605 [Bdellovibrionaceae bacterium]|nr:hypothetical protein [Pseudobdellovibrionaceae bacterium]
MEDGSSQSFLGSLIKNLSSALSEQEQQTQSQVSVNDELDWMENSIEDQDMVDSMNIHKRILDSEIDSIDKELDSILKNRETVEYLVSLLRKRERLETQVHQLEDDIGVLQKEG